ncbi:DNA breaking-rejoining enzyme [Pseudomonas sp. TCU-HL1]|nr:DNA breaking-rejoining enzyme [Pseudomonas sp. TCU-HL1]
MLKISIKQIQYKSIETSLDVKHCILVAHHNNKNILISHPNVFLYSATRSSIKTSIRYASIISMFYRFLSTQKKMKGRDLSDYHVLADNRDIRRWQVSRQIERVRKQSLRPSSLTIFEDAKILLTFFRWLNENNHPTNVKVTLKTWHARFHKTSMLNYVRSQAKTVIDSDNIWVLDKKNRQRTSNFLITDHEIKLLLQSYSDPVYQSLFALALGTAMRPMDLVKFPFIGNGPNKHILPYSEMDHRNSTVLYTVEMSKGNKDRTIVINMDDLRALEANYITPYYSERKKLYKQKYGKACPPGILFLNKKGDPVTEKMIAARTFDAKLAATKADPTFRQHLSFYQSRHWWPTQYIIRTFGDRLLSENIEVLYLATAQVLINQMGHENLETTFKYYVDMARIVLQLHKGKSLDLISGPHSSVTAFIRDLELPSDVLSHEAAQSEQSEPNDMGSDDEGAAHRTPACPPS